MESLEDRQLLSITVNTFVDVRDGNILDGSVSLRDAVEQSVSGDIIDFDPAMMNGATIKLLASEGGEGTEIAFNNKSLTIDASMLSSGLTIDAGDGTDNVFGTGDGFRVFDIRLSASAGEHFAATLKGLTITGGDISSGGGGGGVNFDGQTSDETSSVSLVIDQSTIKNNFASHASGSVDILHGGGGIYASLDRYTSLTIVDSKISGNGTLSGDSGSLRGAGGGILVNLPGYYHTSGIGASFTLQRSVVEGNSAANRGGGVAFAAGADSVVTIEESVITGNDAGLMPSGYYGIGESPDSGGGIYGYMFSGDLDYSFEPPVPGVHSKIAELTISGTTVDNNRAGEHGGGIFICTKREGSDPSIRSEVRVSNSTISGNTAGFADDPRTSILDDAIGKGGGVHVAVYDNGSHVEGVDFLFTNVTVTDNKAAIGGGIYSRITTQTASLVNTRLQNTIVSGNHQHDNDTSNFYGSINQEKSEYNLISDDGVSMTGTPEEQDNYFVDYDSDPRTEIPFTALGTGNQNNGGTNDPGLLPLNDFGGPTLTHNPQSGSPVIDMGDPNFDINDPDGNSSTNDALPFDQRGDPFDRIVGGRIDIGAVEYDVNAGLEGDFDIDGDVDADDLEIWMNSYGMPGLEPFEGGDADGDGDVDGGDFLAWQRNFGAGISGVLAQGLPVGLGDYNFDGTVDDLDRAVWLSGNLDADGNSDGVVDNADLGILLKNFMITTLDILPGDFDESGVVDSDDYDVWFAGDLRADADGDGDVGPDDFVTFRDNFGLTFAAMVPLVTGNTPGVPFGIPLAAPQVLSLTLSGSGSADPPFDFTSVVGSGEQLRSVPVGGADTIQIQFSEEVWVTENALAVTNLDGSSPAVSSFDYDLNTRTATWTFASNFSDGRHLWTLADDVFDMDHELLDGEFTNPWSLSDVSSDVFPSGDGVAGGEFRFRTTILAGDTDHDNIDGTTDYTDWPSIEPGMILVSTTTDELDGDYSRGDMSLREAIFEANLSTEPTEIVVPTGHYTLSRNGSESGDASFNDLDILGEITVTGDGPGLTVLDSGGLTTDGPFSRLFHIDGAGNRLTVSGATLSGGGTHTAITGGVVLAQDQASFELTDSAVANNLGYASGVAITSLGSDITIRRSVFTNNNSTQVDAALHAKPFGGNDGSITIGESIFALNQADNGDITPNVWVESGVALYNEGYNLYDDAAGGFFDVTSGVGDYLGTTGYVVTTIADTFDHTDDADSLSLREAIDLTNNTSGASEVWLPAWSYALTRQSTGPDDNISFGDLEITEALTLRGAGISPVQVVQQVAAYQDVDPVFDLVGDFDQNLIVDDEDFDLWLEAYSETDDPRADANDDGVIDFVDDYFAWLASKGNMASLTLENVAAG